MNKLFVDTTEQHVECEIHEVQMSAVHNTATFRVKGINKHSVTTLIPIGDLRGMLEGKTVPSVYGYFSVTIKDPATVESLKNILYEQQEIVN